MLYKGIIIGIGNMFRIVTGIIIVSTPSSFNHSPFEDPRSLKDLNRFEDLDPIGDLDLLEDLDPLEDLNTLSSNRAELTC